MLCCYRCETDPPIVARVSGQLWDLERPLEADCDLQFLGFNSTEGKEVFWCSSASVLGGVLISEWGGALCRLGSTESGFYSDVHLDQRSLSGSDLSSIEKGCRRIVSQKVPFIRLEVSQDELRELFKPLDGARAYVLSISFTAQQVCDGDNRDTGSWAHSYSLQVRDAAVQYKWTDQRHHGCGSLVTLCSGPHVTNTSRLKVLQLLQVSTVDWGGADGQRVHRVSGVSFPGEEQLKKWERDQEEARRRDHRRIGKDQELFFFHDVSPGSCFFLPKGAHIYNTLTDFIKSEYCRRGFSEVVTPTVFSARLWQRSGHWEHYSENMFTFKSERDTFALKPMNCPAHCLMFDQRPRSWRELPLRWADFGALHRNEVSGSLTGLTRVRRFVQDDAHIFCTPEQLEGEISACLQFLHSVYSVFGFSYRLLLSTRPSPCLGDPALWDTAEGQLQKSLEQFGHPWELSPGDGAFYGPKIDIQIKDAIGRHHQCATIQLDFQLPIRFDLHYTGPDGELGRPVMIHRAILGSVERMIAILAENYGGKWPLWLSPAQVMVIPVGGSTEGYAQEVVRQFQEAGFQVEVDADRGASLSRKIRRAQLGQYNFILVVGEKEMSTGTVSVRTRSGQQFGQRGLKDTLERLRVLRDSRTAGAEDEF
ncbi:threonine--tRNA ligase 1, cytoplasmic-like [Lepisosteus oculatus]|uniref:threonine--tRNA ligase 1, cytoplasmic-like n=1 Tax=Lepisosteus oculatus TaxID=7918 RepID=UPI003710089D